MTGERKDREPRVELRGKRWRVDLRAWGGGRVLLREPTDPGWPKKGKLCPDETTANRWKWAYLDRLLEEKEQEAQGTRHAALSDLVEPYTEYRRAHYEENTAKLGRHAVRRLVDAFGEVNSNTITRTQLQDLFTRLRKNGYSANTLKTLRTQVFSFFEWTGGKNPARDIVLIKEQAKEARAWGDEELVVIREAANRLDAKHKTEIYRLAVELALGTGGRVCELFGMHWEHFNTTSKTVRITQQLMHDGKTLKGLKGKKAGTALVLQEWWPFMRARAIGPVLSVQDQILDHNFRYRLIGAVLKEAGLYESGLGWHTFRHTYARLFIERGGRFEELKMSLRHKSIVTTEQLYGHFHEQVAARLAREKIYGA